LIWLHILSCPSQQFCWDNYALRNDIRHIKKYLEKSRKTILR
jgi:hypothetical protein